MRFRHGLLGGVGVEARNGEKLLHEPRGAAYALLQAAGVLGAVFVGFGAGKELCLKLDAGKWRSQFVGGVAGKALLRCEAVAQALHQPVDGVNKALQFKGKARSFKRRERRRRLL